MLKKIVPQIEFVEVGVNSTKTLKMKKRCKKEDAAMVKKKTAKDPDFPKEEYADYRWKRAMELMRENNLDAIMITDHTNFHWFTGYDPGSHKMRPNILVLPRLSDPAVFIYLKNAGKVLKHTWVENINGYVDCPFRIEEFSDFMEQLGLSDASIGCELSQDQRLGLPFLDFLKLGDSLLPKASFVDAGCLIWDLIMVKTPAELKRIRKACQISDEAFLDWRETLHAGIMQKEAIASLKKFYLEKGATDRQRSGNVSIDNKGWGDPMVDPFQNGDILWVDFGARYKGYVADYSRRLSFGEPNELQKRHHELIWKVLDAEIDAIKPGAKCSEVFTMMNEEMKRLGLPPMNPRKRAGHGIGLESIPPSINAFDQTVLKPNMVLTPEPRFESYYGRVHVEEMVVVTKDGCEVLTHAPRELYVIT